MVNENRLTLKRIRVRIPKQFHQEPIISQLVSLYQVTVNITAAILGANANGDGWFDLELSGNEIQIQDALVYLNDLGLEIWRETDADGW
ncbi:MAG TPA: NIL domain-containing protein [Leptolyngbyaceae cyanobacterium M33_DOE_097]|uniref:ABC transporter n=1 Tax=Oscillatoriales cyanobacterium SpSt-418 TaxID=2282169 RepID=A0A7C3PH94_9CYAN|nr:NIL domain-containing protein [Leptolyngbyaceae cyanobacterium M33_DOE_097]